VILRRRPYKPLVRVPPATVAGAVMNLPQLTHGRDAILFAAIERAEPRAIRVTTLSMIGLPSRAGE
jgi:hypothetical protein